MAGSGEFKSPISGATNKMTPETKNKSRKMPLHGRKKKELFNIKKKFRVAEGKMFNQGLKINRLHK